MIECVWCGFDRLDETADSCAVCGQTPSADSVTLSKETGNSDASTVRREPSTRPAMSRIFASRYLIEAPIGRGGMGSVFRVIDREDGESYALKVLHASQGAASALKRFEREAELLRRISHPSVPKIRDYGIAGDSMYLVVELIEGMNLRDTMTAGGAFAPEEVARIGASIAECLDAAHAHGIIHRDVKPHNVMLARDGSIRLIDFGIARDAAVNATAITGSDTVLGTPQYMAPEQFEGARVDARVDVYSLGVLLFELATGRPPFRAETPTALALKHVGERPPHPRSINMRIPMLLNRVILKCLEKNPYDRYPTAGDLANDLHRSMQAKRHIERTRLGDFIVDEDTGEGWALVLASGRERPWSPGMTLFYGGAYFRLDRVDYDEAYPAPFVYRFKFWPDSEAIRRFVDYETEPVPAPKSGIGKWFSRS